MFAGCMHCPTDPCTINQFLRNIVPPAFPPPIQSKIFLICFPEKPLKLLIVEKGLFQRQKKKKKKKILFPSLSRNFPFYRTRATVGYQFFRL
jgi:hypothetical protein